jgi:hypothetical protein
MPKPKARITVAESSASGYGILVEVIASPPKAGVTIQHLKYDSDAYMIYLNFEQAQFLRDQLNHWIKDNQEHDVHGFGLPPH